MATWHTHISKTKNALAMQLYQVGVLLYSVLWKIEGRFIFHTFDLWPTRKCSSAHMCVLVKKTLIFSILEAMKQRHREQLRCC